MTELGKWWKWIYIPFMDLFNTSCCIDKRLGKEKSGGLHGMRNPKQLLIAINMVIRTPMESLGLLVSTIRRGFFQPYLPDNSTSEQPCPLICQQFLWMKLLRGMVSRIYDLDWK